MKPMWLDAIMGVLLGDALGLPVQFIEREELKKNPVTGMRGYGTFHMPEGTWSDDGSLTLATMESILQNNGVNCEDIMENFADWLLNGKFTPFGRAFDEGATCVKAITKYIQTGDVGTCGVTGEWANGNGALMRIMPVCLYVYQMEQENQMSEEEAVACVQQVSALTHNHIRSQMACGIYYFIVKSILQGGRSLKEALALGISEAKAYYQKDIENYTEFTRYGRIWDMEAFESLPETEIRSSGYVVDTLEAAIWSLLCTDTFEDALLCAVNLGKDTDTVGAIAGGLAGLYYGYEAMPEIWLSKLQKREKIEQLCLHM